MRVYGEVVEWIDAAEWVEWPECNEDSFWRSPCGRGWLDKDVLEGDDNATDDWEQVCMSVEEAAAAPGVTAEGGAARPIINDATLFAVPGAGSSVLVGKEVLFPPLPNESHLDAFFTIGGMIDVGVGAVSEAA